MSDEIDILIEFKRQISAFFDELIAQFPLEGDLIVLRLFLSTQMPIKEVMDEFILKISTNDNKLRQMIKERNEAFFLEYSVFGSVDKDKVLHFKKLWRSGQLDADDKTVIWNWIDAFVYLSDKYTKMIIPPYK